MKRPQYVKKVGDGSGEGKEVEAGGTGKSGKKQSERHLDLTVPDDQIDTSQSDGKTSGRHRGQIQKDGQDPCQKEYQRKRKNAQIKKGGKSPFQNSHASHNKQEDHGHDNRPVSDTETQ